MLSEKFQCALVLEQFTDNPFLPFFYENPERYGFPVELFFMTERHKQLQEHFSEPNLFSQMTISDYFFVKTLLFAKNNLNEEEFRLFQRLFGVLNASFPNPDLLVYLHRPIPVLLDQIKKRGRDMEKYISAEYLGELHEAYMQYFKKEKKTPVLVISLNDADFQSDPLVFDRLLLLLSDKYPKGLNYRTLQDAV